MSIRLQRIAFVLFFGLLVALALYAKIEKKHRLQIQGQTTTHVVAFFM